LGKSFNAQWYLRGRYSKDCCQNEKVAYVAWNQMHFPGLLGNVISVVLTRLILGGINSVVDAACAASFECKSNALSE